MSQYRDMLRLHEKHFSNVSIAQSLGVGRNTVSRALKRAAAEGLTWEIACGMSEGEVAERLYGNKRTDRKPNQEESPYLQPDCEWIARETARPNVTLRLLWTEYTIKADEAGKKAYGQTQFNKIYAEYRRTANVTMHIEHVPGEFMEVDWAGNPVYYTDPEAGGQVKCYVFVAVLPYSGYSYAEAMPSMMQNYWYLGHIHAYEFFGGVTRMVRPDNLKASVIHNGKDELVLNRTYAELAEHYGTAVMPARVRKPRDKATVEGLVRNVGTHVIAAMRDSQFFSLFELNVAIRSGMEAFNAKPFQAREGSRLSVFQTEELATLIPLPAVPFEICEWRQATVQNNSHVSVAQMYYSVPYQYVKQRVDIKLTPGKVEIFCKDTRIAVHERRYGRPFQYISIPEHMPEEKQTTWNRDRFLAWARKIGQSTERVIDSMLRARPIEQQAYRGCQSVLHLSEGANEHLLEDACALLLCAGARPSYKTVKAYFDRVVADAKYSGQAAPDEPSEFIRGAEYYGGEG